MKKKEKGLWCLLFCIVLGMFISCSGEKKAQPQTGSDGKFNVVLNFVGVNNVNTDAFVQHIDEFKEKTGISISAQRFSNEQASNKLAISFAAGGGDIDVFMIRPLDETKLFIQNDWLEPLDAYIVKDSAFDVADYYDAPLGVCSDDNGNIHALPLQTEGPVVYYNKKMFEAKGITKLPATMNELMDTARRLHDPANDIAGFVCRGKGGPSITMFSTFLRSFGGDFFDKSGNAAFNSSNALEAIGFYGELLRNYGPKGVLNMGWIETVAVFTQGKAAMRLDADGQYPYMLNEKDSVVAAEDIGCFKVPVGPRGDNGTFKITAWAVAISPFSKNKEAAWKVTSWIAGKEMDVRAQALGGSSARKSTWAMPEANTWPPELVKVANESAVGAWPSDRPFMINVGEARTIMGEAISAAINGDDYKTVANKANDEFQKLLDSEKKK